MEQIILASSSPRREEYFRLLGLPFITVAPEVDETFDPNKDARYNVERLAVKKVSKVIETHAADNPLWICGADTVVTLKGKIFGKPNNRDEAREMLLALEGNTHEVISAVALFNRRTDTIDCRSRAADVSFGRIREKEIEWYLDSGEWQDAAGAYKIQGLASCFAYRIEGSYSAIVGLPLRDFYVMLRDNGYLYGAS